MRSIVPFWLLFTSKGQELYVKINTEWLLIQTVVNKSIMQHYYYYSKNKNPSAKNKDKNQN